MKKFSPGDLVEVLADRTATEDGFTTARAGKDNSISLYKTIKIDHFPSYDDFEGPVVTCFHRQSASVVRYVGRPSKIKKDDRFWEYDVYEVLVSGQSAQIFATNLELLTRVKDVP